jgi:hypothetical protein
MAEKNVLIAGASSFVGGAAIECFDPASGIS